MLPLAERVFLVNCGGEAATIDKEKTASLKPCLSLAAAYRCAAIVPPLYPIGNFSGQSFWCVMMPSQMESEEPFDEYQNPV
jgi:hypothetical protein